MTVSGKIESGLERHRIEWIDFIKGVAITLVVYGHVMQGTVAANLLPASFFFHASDAFIYSFHMPAFFIVSGLLSRSLWRISTSAYIAEKARTIAWPYVLWFIIGTMSVILFSRFYNHSNDNPWLALANMIWNPAGFWFLHAFFFVHVLAALLKKFPLYAMLILSVGGFWLAEYCPNEALHNILHYFPFLVIGLVGCQQLLKIDLLFQRWGFILFVPLLAWQLAITLFIASPYWPIKLLLGFSGTSLLAALAMILSKTLLFPIASRVGAASLGVFLMHPYFQGISRAVLLRLPGLHNPILLVFLETLCGVVFPVFIFEYLMSTRLRVLFTLKDFKFVKTQSLKDPVKNTKT